MITTSKHPFYKFDDYNKYRITYEGGRLFVTTYLERYSLRETTEAFLRRTKMTYCPGFAKEGLDEIQNAIYQRMTEIIRLDATPSFLDCAEGNDGGVDLQFTTMNKFMGRIVLPELMALGKVGVYVDMPKFNPDSILAQFTNTPHPYLYMYRAEDILNWNFTRFGNELILTSLILRESYIADNEHGLPAEMKQRFRYLRLVPGGVELKILVQVYDKKLDKLEEIVEQVMFLNLSRIPFVLGDIGSSLLKNIDDYQIGLLNLSSSDIKYALDCNFPIYTEQYDPKVQDKFSKVQVLDGDGELMTDNPQATEVATGLNHGRQYPIGAERPAFINPSTEPLTASMAKQEQMKADIRRLLSLAVSNVAVSRASAESKKVDNSGLESGVSVIGLELESMELQIAKIWASYENLQDSHTPMITYPREYNLKTDQDRINQAKGYKELKGIAPSRLFSKEMSKLAAYSLLKGKVTTETMDNITSEIDKSNYATGDAQEIQIDLEAGLVTLETASNARGYDGKKETPLAANEHAARLARITIAQSSGNPDIGNNKQIADTKLEPTQGRGDA